VLHPELSDRADELYSELQSLPFVGRFPGRGHNLHERNRNLLLTHLWQQNQTEYHLLSSRLASYFAQQPNDAIWQTERLYHFAVDPNWLATELNETVQNWLQHCRYAEVEILLNRLLEQVDADRTTDHVTSNIYACYGRSASRSGRSRHPFVTMTGYLVPSTTIGSVVESSNVVILSSESVNPLISLGSSDSSIDRSPYEYHLAIDDSNPQTLGAATSSINYPSIVKPVFNPFGYASNEPDTPSNEKRRSVFISGSIKDVELITADGMSVGNLASHTPRGWSDSISEPEEVVPLLEAIALLQNQLLSALNKGYTYEELASILQSVKINIKPSTLKRYLALSQNPSVGRKP
jgi:hypothetical protein